MVDFIGRQAELRVLNDAYASPTGAFVPVYGRRRVGKSALIIEFLHRHEHAGIYYVGKQAPAEAQKREFLREAAAAAEQPYLAHLAMDNWQDILRATVDGWKSAQKLVLVLDEFQWLAEVSPELPSILQGLWDQHWRDSGRVMLILCGSYMGFMEREVLGRKSPLFGRRTAQIHLRPFSFGESARFHPGWSAVDHARAWFICGGIPQYLECLESRRSIEQNIERQLLTPTAPLWSEPDFLLREELRDVHRYNAILSAVATGSLTHLQIARAAGIEPRSVDYYLRHLVEIGYISRRSPLTGNPPNARLIRYALEDPLLRFWFRFVYPNMSFVLKMGPEAAFHERIRTHLDSYFGSCFERLCREALPDLYRQEGVHAAFEVGEYWSEQAQIDVVGLRDDNRTDLGECKWGDVSIAETAVELRAKTSLFPNARGATLGLRLFLRNRPPRARLPAGVQCHTLADLYDANR